MRRPGIEPQDVARVGRLRATGFALSKNTDRIQPGVCTVREVRLHIPAEELTLESLILAQDERWRRA